MKGQRKAWRLRNAFSALLVVTMLIAFSLAGGILLLVRIPQIAQDSRAEVAREAQELTARVEILLGALEAQVALLSDALPAKATPDQINALFDKVVAKEDGLGAIYLVSAKGTVLAAGVDLAMRAQRNDLLGSDLSGTQLFNAAAGQKQLVWGDKYLSVLSGAVTVGLAQPLPDGRLLVAEVPFAYLLSTVQLAAGKRSSSIWLADQRGEVLADSVDGGAVNAVNMLNLPVMQAAISQQPLPLTFNFLGHDYYPAVAHSRRLDWYFVAGRPAGLENAQIRDAILFVLAGGLGSLLVGLILAPFWAAWLSRALMRTVERAGLVARGEPIGKWPHGPIEELNTLASSLELMADSLKMREQKLQAIFNTAPVTMSITDLDHGGVLLDVNEAWCRAFKRTREDVLGHSLVDIGVWRSREERTEAMARANASAGQAEAWLVRGDGTEMLCQAFGRAICIGNHNLMIWATMDITAVRRIEDELRDLNVELEGRVASRTKALEKLNTELSAVVANLQMAQGELVRAEKMAALGSLVAGVSHELNTPLGNGLMAVSSMADAARSFRVTMQGGLKRSDLEDLLVRFEQGSDIGVRNLRRAADLVSSFKQVAVDQTSSQRRSFELSEVVDEMVVSLRPTLRRTPFDIVVEVPATGLLLDSYPGPLGQTIGNLINNAVMHGFEGRDQGAIRIEGALAADGTIVLRVSDNGNGIPVELMDRIFDPFVTTKMGRGGTGLGLHIAYNAVTNLMGGTLTATSAEGVGTTFELRLPPTAP
jgi:PAS domain S-box-containing protein